MLATRIYAPPGGVTAEGSVGPAGWRREGRRVGRLPRRRGVDLLVSLVLRRLPARFGETRVRPTAHGRSRAGAGSLRARSPPKAGTAGALVRSASTAQASLRSTRRRDGRARARCRA